MVKKILLILLSAMSLFFVIAGIVHVRHANTWGIQSKVPHNVEVISVSKDDYEVLDDGTVLIYCTYLLRYDVMGISAENAMNEEWCEITGEEFVPKTLDPINVSIGGVFYTEKEKDFLEENILIADGTYTLEFGVDTIINVVFVAHHGTHELMPDRLPPEPYIFLCDPYEV